MKCPRKANIRRQKADPSLGLRMEAEVNSKWHEETCDAGNILILDCSDGFININLLKLIGY